MEIDLGDCDRSHEDVALNIQQTTSLSKREAEIYVLTEIAGLKAQEAADVLGVSLNRICTGRHRYRTKIVEAEETAKLQR